MYRRIALLVLMLVATLGVQSAHATTKKSLVPVFLRASDLPQSKYWDCGGSNTTPLSSVAQGTCTWHGLDDAPYIQSKMGTMIEIAIHRYKTNALAHQFVMRDGSENRGMINWRPTSIGDERFAFYNNHSFYIEFSRNGLVVDLYLLGKGVNPAAVAHLARLIDQRIVLLGD